MATHSGSKAETSLSGGPGQEKPLASSLAAAPHPNPLPAEERGEGIKGAGGAASATPTARAIRGFEATRAWVFDLDNTLYPAECNLFAQVDHRMGEFIARFLGVPYAYARHLQKSYYRQFGTTLSGLMQVHKMDPRPFLDYVHDIDLSVVDAHPDLAAAIERLPGRKLIYTNGSRSHAERVAEKLGVLHLFEDIFDIVASEYVPKPQAGPYKKFLGRHGVDPAMAAMFEDMPHNLAAAHALGMTTVLVHSSYVDHPVQLEIRKWTEPPEHVHHMTEDLAEFLGPLGGRVDATGKGRG